MVVLMSVLMAVQVCFLGLKYKETAQSVQTFGIKHSALIDSHMSTHTKHTREL
jgi:hypothetical protein